MLDAAGTSNAAPILFLQTNHDSSLPVFHLPLLFFALAAILL